MDQDYGEFTKQWLAAGKIYLAPENAVYIFQADARLPDVIQAMRDESYYYSQIIFWIKNAMVLGRKDYNPQHEVIVYGWHGKHKFYRRKSKNLIFHPKPHRSVLHPTMKPVGLLRKLILNSSQIGDLVYDPFAGSGSTLIACENTKRRCLSIEIDPGYCQTIIDRWGKLTGQTSQKVL